MAQTIKLKRSAVSGNTPSTSDLELGEIAINTYDGKVFIKKNDGSASVVEVGAADNTKLPLAGGTLTGNLSLGDSTQTIFGAGSDLTIFSNGTHGLIKAGNASADIRIESDSRIVMCDRGFNESFAIFNDDDDVKLFHDGSQRFATTSGGIQVTGDISNASGNLTLDVAGDIILDADGGDVRLKDNGTEFLNFYAGTIERTGGSLNFDVAGNITLNADGSTISLKDDTINFGQFFNNASGQFNIFAPTQDKDIVFLGNDGGSTITAATFDMSNEGHLTLNDGISINASSFVNSGTLMFTNTGNAAFVDNRQLFFGSSLDMTIKHNSATGNNEILTNSDFLLDSAGDIILDADGADILLKDDGTEFGRFSRVTSDFVIKSATSDKDIIFKGNDGGSTITALTLDMSEAGAAIFSGNVTVSGNLEVTGTTTQTGSTITNSNFTGLSNANAANATDFGFFGKYVESSTTKYAGMYYDASTDNTFKLFCDTQTAPTTTVNESATGYALGKLQVGGLIVNSGTINTGTTFQSTDDAVQLNFTDDDTTNSLTSSGVGFRFVMDNVEKFRFAQNGRFGIGTTSPLFLLHAETDSDVVSYFKSTDNKASILISDDDTNTYVSAESSTSSIGANNGRHANNLNISSTGNVGIGIISPALQSAGTGLHINGSSNAEIKFTNSTTGTAATDGTALVASGSSFNINNREAGNLIFGTNNSERMRIDSSGNLLVGKTSSSGNTVGAEMRANGGIFGTKDGAYVARFNRKTSDGSIVELQKDGSTVGQIGTVASSIYLGGDSNGGIYINGQTDIRPWNTSSQANLDNSMSLGSTSARFKDLHLSGTISSGAITSTGLTVNGDGVIQDATPTLEFKDTDNNLIASVGGASGSLLLKADTGGGTSGESMQFHTGGSEKGRFDSSGRLLIAATSTSFSDKFYINNTAYSTGGWRVGTGSTFVGKTYNDSGVMTFETDSTRSMKFVGGTVGEIMRIDGVNGRVGIGTTSPSTALEVNDDAGTVATLTGISSGGVTSVLMKQSRGTIASPSNSSTAGDGNYLVSQVYNSGYASIGNIGIITGSAVNHGVIQFQTANSGTVAERMRIDNAGNLGIGTTSPDTKLDITTSGVHGLILNQDTVSSNVSSRLFFRDSTRTNLILSVNGNLEFRTGGAVGSTSGTVRLSVLGSGAVRFNNAYSFPTADGSTGQALITDGSGNITFGSVSAGAASSMVDADGDTKIQVEESSDEDVIRFDTAGTERMTLSPSVLSVRGIATPEIELLPTGSVGNADLRFDGTTFDIRSNSSSASLLLSTTSTERMRITAGGNVGIGTSFLPNKFHVDGNARIEGNLMAGGAAASNIPARPIHVKSSGDAAAIRIEDSTSSNLAYDLRSTHGTGLLFVDVTNSATRMTIADDGNVGIGTTSPDEKLSIAPDTDVSAEIGRAHVGYIGHSDYAGFSHIDRNTVSAYSLLQGAAGQTYINSASGQPTRFRINNVDTMILTSSGDLGIGTTAPASKLHVEDNGDASKAILFRNSSNGSGAYAALKLRSDQTPAADSGLYLNSSGNTNYAGANQLMMYQYGSNPLGFITNNTLRMIVTGAGNVGIGTTVPSYKLHVKETTTNAGGIQVDDGTSWLRFVPSLGGGGYNSLSTAGDIGIIFSTDNDSGSSASNGLVIAPHSAASGAQGIKIMESGNVGIGTTSPSEMLEVAGNVESEGLKLNVNTSMYTQNASLSYYSSTNAVYLNGAGNNGWLRLNASGTSNDAYAINLFGSSAGACITFKTNSAERMRITNTGNVGIGTTAPQTNLHIGSGTGNQLGILLSRGATSNFLVCNDGTKEAYIGTDNTNAFIKLGSLTNHPVQISQNNGNAIYIDTSKNVGIGTTSPAHKIHIASGTTNVGIQTISTDAGAYMGFEDDSTGNTGSNSNVFIGANGNNFLIHTNATERMRVDSSGNLMVGTTNSTHHTGSSAQGITLSKTYAGLISASRSGAQPLIVNRQTSEGIAIDVRRDGSTVGSIGTYSQDSQANFYIGFNNGSSDVGLGFGHASGTGRAYYPCRDNGSGVSGAIDLGTSTYKYKDLHLSGNANVGGNLVVTGDLTINGTTTTLNTATLNVEDKNITLNYGTGDTSSTADGAGITIQDAVDASNNATILWDATTDRFDFSHDIHLPDDRGVRFGADGDLTIFHDGSDSFIRDSGTGGLYIRASSFLSIQNAVGSETMIYAANDGAVQLKYDNSTKLATSSGGVSVTGALSASGNISSGFFEIGDDTATTTATTQVSIASFSASSVRSCKLLVQVTNTTDSTYHFTEIAIIHDGTDTYMTEVGTMFTGAAAEATFTSDISSGSVRLLATPASTDSMTFKVVRQMISA